MTTSLSKSVAQELDPFLVTMRLRSVRLALGVSQREAAELARISKSVLEKYESTKNERVPNTRQLFKLAGIYGVTTDYLLGLR